MRSGKRLDQDSSQRRRRGRTAGGVSCRPRGALDWWGCVDFPDLTVRANSYRPCGAGALSTDQGSSDLIAWTRLDCQEEYKEVSIPQYRSGQFRREMLTRCGWIQATSLGLNPSVQIRAVPTGVQRRGYDGLGVRVSIPQYRSGQFRRAAAGGAASIIRIVSIPQYRSGQFRACLERRFT